MWQHSRLQQSLPLLVKYSSSICWSVESFMIIMRGYSIFPPPVVHLILLAEHLGKWSLTGVNLSFKRSTNKVKRKKEFKHGPCWVKLLAFLLLKGIPSRAAMEPRIPRDVGDRSWPASVAGGMWGSPQATLPQTSALNSVVTAQAILTGRPTGPAVGFNYYAFSRKEWKDSILWVIFQLCLRGVLGLKGVFRSVNRNLKKGLVLWIANYYSNLR